MTPRDTRAALRDDVRLLGELLGDTIRQHEGDEVFGAVEAIRQLAKGARKGTAEPGALSSTLSASLEGLPRAEALAVARAFTHFLNLANIAERQHHIRLRREALRDPASLPHVTGAPFEEALERLLDAGVSKAAIHQLVCDMRIDLVLTAHPTEVNRRTLLGKHNHIAALLAKRDRDDRTSLEDSWLEDELRREITSIWCTDEILRRRPTPVEEANGGLLVFEQTLWDVIPHHGRVVDAILKRVTGEGLPLERFPIRFGSWMGGDRDGNPNVTPEVTRRVVALARWMAAELYWRELDALRAELALEPASEELLDRTGRVREPYRALLAEVRAKMARTREWAMAIVHRRQQPEDPDVYLRAEEVRKPLMLIWRSLHEVGAGIVAEGRLLDILRRLACFGLTLVELDIRQEADRHTEALEAVTSALGLGAYGQWDEAQRQAFLIRELQGRRPLVPRDLECSPEVRDVLQTFAVIAEQSRESLGSYVISMATSPSDVLAVELLQREAGARDPLPVVPLFETLDDLRGAGEAVSRLLDIGWFRERVRARGDRLQIMIGYSDSAKDAGLLTASWALYKAQEAMVEACRARGVSLTLFHGRGGSVGRGGGPAQRGILALPPGAIDGTMRVTEQGEVIQAKFGLPGIARHTLELYLGAVAEAALAPPEILRPEWRALMDRLAEDAMQVYRGVVRGDERFVPYFRAVTPEQQLGTLNIGSRPARRRAGGGVETLRAIPWVFAWTQTRLLLPSWLGVGTALRNALDGDDRALLLEMAERCHYFQTFLALVEMVLAKAEPYIHAHYERVLAPPEVADLGETLRTYHRRSQAAVLEVLGHERLLQDNPSLRETIDVRNPYMDPLHILQAELLRQAREADEGDTLLRDALSVTVNGIAAGMRNTG